MTNELHMERRAAIKSFFDRWAMYDFKAIEATASPSDVESRYTDMVLQSDIVIVILADTLRVAVQQEFQIATKANKRIFVFIHSQITDPKLKEFIKTEIGLGITRCTFNNLSELIDKIEESLLDDLANSYKKWWAYEKQKKQAYVDKPEVR